MLGIPLKKQPPLRTAITEAYRMDEALCLEKLIQQATLPEESLARIKENAKYLVNSVREKRLSSGMLDAFLSQYDLSNEEGIALMCLAEALLRVPDRNVADQLIKDKLLSANWKNHLGRSNSVFVNAATWGLMLTGQVFNWKEDAEQQGWAVAKKLLLKSGEPLIRKSIAYAMKILGRQFVMGRTIDEGLKRAKALEQQGYRYSYDMLGEAARTEDDADRYFKAYQHAIESIGKVSQGRGPLQGPGISIKLSALHPRYEFSQQAAVKKTLIPRLTELAVQAMHYNLGLTVDAEEADRLDLSLDVIEAVFTDPRFKGWEGFGLAVQSYQKRALPLIDWLADLANSQQRRIMIRLIKGAYWDTEIKLTQEQGLEDYPVFTRKTSTDVSFIACAKRILATPTAFYSQFATHNAYSVAAVLEMAGERNDFEFQCLHGMGETLYDEIVAQHPCRIYAPVGSHETLLPYLVRRLLENGANTSFVNRIADQEVELESLVVDPVALTSKLEQKAHPRIPLPINLYGSSRLNSLGIDLTNYHALASLERALKQHVKDDWRAMPLLAEASRHHDAHPVYGPNDQHDIIGHVSDATAQDIGKALSSAVLAARSWNAVEVDTRASCLEKAADLLEGQRDILIAMLLREAGKTLPDALSEVREAVDFCRYYAAQAREQLMEPMYLRGVTGEINKLQCSNRGVVVCISPWNFPLAIFMGQISAALVTGNAVIAKPAEQTPIIACEAVKLLHEAGIPSDVLQCLPGRGETIGAALVEDPRVNGVIFTGSFDTARLINQSLANRSGPIGFLIAETGGQNAMIVDSTALPEQLVLDVMHSAFGSGGQRCSALRVLFIQEDICAPFLETLKGAMAELQVGHSGALSTDVGPVIDQDALALLEKHKAYLKEKGCLIYEVSSGERCPEGCFFAPCAYEIEDLSLLKQEVFGPILHVIRYAASDLDQVVEAINKTGYGLTLGVHSRIDALAESIADRVRVGNVYINRNMTGAIVGVQPFGGEGLSGTGPKAGGPHYLQRLCSEKVISIDTTAAGGNASLMSLEN